MSTFTTPLVACAPRRRRSPRLMAVALVPGSACASDVVPAVSAGDAQCRLVELGLLPERAATGTWNVPTADAIRRFQADSGLDTSGVAGTITAARLRIR